MSHFYYSSSQTHSVIENGHPTSLTESTEIKNGKGYKMVIKQVGKKKTFKKIKLDTNEIKNIKNRKFMPDLFRPCLDGCNRDLGLILSSKGTKKTKRKQMRLRRKTMKQKKK